MDFTNKRGDLVMKIIEEQYRWARTNWTIQKPDTIVIHHALSPNCTAQDVHRWHLENGWKGIAYHYFIRKDGSIYRGRQENHKGGHLMGSENNNTIGICLEGCYTDYVSNGKALTEKAVPETQMTALIWLCNDIKTRWNINAVKKHADYPSAIKEGKDCCGKYFPWNDFILRVNEGMNLVKFQTAAKYVDVYKGEVDNKAGKLTKEAAEQFLTIILEILSLKNPKSDTEMKQLMATIEEYQNENTLLKTKLDKTKQVIQDLVNDLE